MQADGQLAFPSDYREWVFLSAGLGMNYGPNAPAEGQPQSFTNVYVNPSSYRSFMKTGAWPDRTLFVLEIRGLPRKDRSTGRATSRPACRRLRRT